MTKIAIPQMGTDLFRKYMKSKYSKALENAGAQAVWIELENVENAIKSALECDGLLLPGGADISPELYGENPIPECGNLNEIRDNSEPKILNAFMKTGKPIFCICRGIQMLNVCLGGTLIQDIKPIQNVNHSDFFHRAKFTHGIKIQADSMLYDIVKKEEIMVNSIHHQTVKTLGNGLKITAESDDGFIEAIELESYGFCLGVQWHPEHMAKKNADQQKLFNAFIDACNN